MQPVAASTQPIIFFDGVCGLCNWFVDWVIKRDKRNIFLFAPLQGESAKRFIGALSGSEEGWSIIYVDEAGAHQRSTAVLKIMIRLGSLCKAFAIFFILPQACRDALYRFIARRRYQWFGKKDACRLPSAQERSKFLP